MPQPQKSKKPLGKGVVIGAVLLILSLIFFSLAGIIAFSNMTQSNDLVTIFIAVGAVLVAPALLIIYIDSRSGIFISPHIGTPKP